MQTIERKLKGKLEVFSIYTQEEADRRGFKYVYWKDAHAGDLALSDDGYIGVCLERHEYNRNKVKPLIKTCYGRAWRNGTLSFIERRDNGAFSASTCKKWDELEVKTERAKRFVRAYVEMFMRYKKIDWKRLGEIYRPDLTKPAKYAKKLFRNQRVTDMIKQELKRVLDARGINEEAVIDLFNDAVAIARENKQPAPIIRVAENYSDMLGMKGLTLSPNDPLAGLSVVDGVYDELESESQHKLTNGKPVEAEIVEESTDDG